MNSKLHSYDNSYSASQWREILADKYGFKSRTSSPSGFVGLRTEWSVGDLSIFRACVSGQRLMPENGCLKPPFQDCIIIKLFFQGQTRIEGSRNSTSFDSAGMIVIDSSNCNFEEFMTHASYAVVTVPKQLLREKGIRCDLDPWIVPDLRSPNFAMIHEHLLWVVRTTRRIDAELHGRVSGQVIEMMDIVLAQNKHSKNSRSADSTLRRVKAIIHERLGEPGMDASAIAATTRLSVSYLNHLFRSDGKSLMDYLWTRRLERASRLLASPGSLGAQVEEIAWQCGFSSSSHFCHRFRQYFGMTPSKYRASKQSI